jgi:hypothetical protein
MGAPDSPVAHRTATVHCPVRATSARPLGFGAVDHWSRPVHTGQSGDFWLLRSDFYRGTVHHCSSDETTADSPDSPVHTRQSGELKWSASNRNPRVASLLVVWPGASDSVRCAKNQHTLSLAPIFDWVPNWISFLVCVEPYAPMINDI